MSRKGGGDPDVRELEKLAEEMAAAVGRSGAAILERRQKLQDEMVGVWAQRDRTLVHLAAVLGILTRMGWRPTFAQDAEVVERAAAWVKEMAPDD